jgi:hypothetical protein
MDWSRLILTSEEVAAGAVQPYREAFFAAFTAARGPRTMALFARELDDGGVELLFSPESAEHAAPLLEEWGAHPCERPALLGLELLVGHTEMTYYMI